MARKKEIEDGNKEAESCIQRPPSPRIISFCFISAQPPSGVEDSAYLPLQERMDFPFHCAVRNTQQHQTNSLTPGHTLVLRFHTHRCEQSSSALSTAQSGFHRSAAKLLEGGCFLRMSFHFTFLLTFFLSFFFFSLFFLIALYCSDSLVPPSFPSLPHTSQTAAMPVYGQRTMVQADNPTLKRLFTQEDMVVQRLPGRTFPNPCKKVLLAKSYSDNIEHIMFDPRTNRRVEGFPLSRNELSCELAGARSTIHFNPCETTFGIVTCGGLCPGLNDVIRSITLAGIEHYGVKRVIGFRFGYWGLSKEGSKNAIELSRATVNDIHRFGGSILGSSRGPQSFPEMVDTLERLGVNVLFTVGGDGTQRGALGIYEAAKKRGSKIAVFGVPKTIDNDLSFSHRTFGFQTAVEKATEAVRAAYAEASSLHYGVGIVKLMGRDSGFIAAQTAVASAQANICLIPERPLPKETVLKLIERHFESSKNCVIIVAEGFGQDWVSGPGGHDASGNKKLIDIGALLKKEVEGWLKANVKKYPQYQVKYIDPSYMIRACPPTPNDALFCNSLATLAVHEAMAGATGCIIAMRYNNYILVPINVATSVRRVLDVKGLLWRQVRELTVGLKSNDIKDKTEAIRREMEALSRRRSLLEAQINFCSIYRFFFFVWLSDSHVVCIYMLVRHLTTSLYLFPAFVFVLMLSVVPRPSQDHGRRKLLCRMKQVAVGVPCLVFIVRPASLLRRGDRVENVPPSNLVPFLNKTIVKAAHEILSLNTLSRFDTHTRRRSISIIITNVFTPRNRTDRSLLLLRPVFPTRHASEQPSFSPSFSLVSCGCADWLIYLLFLTASPESIRFTPPFAPQIMSVIAGQRTMVQADKATLNRFTQADMKVERLPGRTFPNPCKKRVLARAYKDDVEEIMFDPKPQKRVEGFPLSRNELTCELAAARSTIHFNPSETTFGIVTCGGICPGLNDVIRSITLAGIEQYGVKRVIGFRFGYWGLSKEGSKNAIELSRATVREIHRFGGTILGSSRGPQTPQEMVDTLERLGVNVLFTVGGDGTQRGALRIYEEARKRGANISVFGVPKTIDNDLSFSHRTFGFQTAVEKGTEAVRAAYAEASSLHYGVGIVKLMGRDSGFIAAQTAVASAQANICLIPERPLPKETVLKLIERHFQRSKNCVIIVAEGFGQDWVSGPGGHDASGNKKLIDIGALLKKEVEGWLKANVKKYPQYQVKYIDPSYMIRACPPTPNDALFCNSLATLAVHEAMAGATGCIIAMRYNNYILVPIRVATSVRRVLDIKGLLWRQVREITAGLNGDAKTEIREDIRREMLALEREEAPADRIVVALAVAVDTFFFVGYEMWGDLFFLNVLFFMKGAGLIVWRKISYLEDKGFNGEQFLLMDYGSRMLFPKIGPLHALVSMLLPEVCFETSENSMIEE
eukprot:gene2332-1466_t